MRTKDPCEGGKRNKTKKLKQTLEIDNIAICKLYLFPISAMFYDFKKISKA